MVSEELDERFGGGDRLASSPKAALAVEADTAILERQEIGVWMSAA